MDHCTPLHNIFIDCIILCYIQLNMLLNQHKLINMYLTKTKRRENHYSLPHKVLFIVIYIFLKKKSSFFFQIYALALYLLGIEFYNLFWISFYETISIL